MSSKFDDMFMARGEGAGSAEAKGRKGSVKKSSLTRKGTSGVAGAAKKAGATDGEALKRRGRPHGKRSDPDYVGFTTYIRRDTHHEVKVALLQEKKGRELSELVEDLLAEWLKSQAKN